MNFPRPDEESKEFFASVIPKDPRVKVRPMFGNQAAFVNGNMFAGLFGDSLFVRLPDKARNELLQSSGAATFEPMEGRPMKEYVVIPRAWRDRPETARAWIARSLEWVGELPAKVKKR